MLDPDGTSRESRRIEKRDVPLRPFGNHVAGREAVGTGPPCSEQGGCRKAGHLLRRMENSLPSPGNPA